ncbi:RNAse P [Aphelenchoides avenae]|nr:RNAse P [Aphelenchus avenae]
MGRSAHPQQKNQEPRVSETALRVSFLQQAATVFCAASSQRDDALNSLSKWYMREQREVCFVEQTHVDKDAKRTVCRKCRRIWVPDRSGRPPLTIRKGRQKMWATCGDCDAVKGLPLNTKYRKPQLESLREFRDGHREQRPVSVPVEMWQLYEEYNVPDTLERIYRVNIRASKSSSKEVRLTLDGRNAAIVARMLADPPLKLQVHERVTVWLLAEGPNGLRLRDILKKTGALVKPSQDNESVLLTGSRESTLAAKSIIDGLHIKRRLIPRAACCWLTNKAEGSEFPRSLEHDRKFNTSIGLGPHNGGDPSRMVELTVVGELEEDVDNVLAIIDALHIKRRRIPAPVHFWLTNKAKGAGCARKMYLEWKFDAYIAMEQPDAGDPAGMVDLAVVGEREEDVDQVLAEIGNITVEKVSVTELQFEFLYGHDGEEQHRSHHKLEDDTDTCTVRDDGAGCMYVAGRLDNVQEALERLRKSRHIKLKTQRVSLANDDRQIHLRHDRLLHPSTCELRCLHRVDSEEDDAKAEKAYQKLMQELGFHEVVLDVHMSWARLLCEQSRRIEDDEVVGISVSEWVNERVLVNIVGSQTTVKRGTAKVIKLITSNRRYRVGDIRLRRIEGQSVDTAGFEKAAPGRKEDLSNCKEPFLWERLTHEQWRYTGRASANRKRKPSTGPKNHKAPENE